MKKFISLLFVLFCLFAVQSFAQKNTGHKGHISVSIFFEDTDEPFTTSIHIDYDPNDGKSFGGGTSRGSEHCDSPSCSYGFAGTAYKTSKNKFDVSVWLSFSEKWEKCDIKKKFQITKNRDVKMNLNCNMKLIAKFVLNSKKEG